MEKVLGCRKEGIGYRHFAGENSLGQQLLWSTAEGGEPSPDTVARRQGTEPTEQAVGNGRGERMLRVRTARQSRSMRGSRSDLRWRSENACNRLESATRSS